MTNTNVSNLDSIKTQSPRQSLTLDPTAFLNLGTLSLKAQQPASAVAYLTQAQIFAPDSQTIAQQLQLAKSELNASLSEEVQVSGGYFYDSLLPNSMISSHSLLNNLQLIFSIATLLCVFLLFARTLLKSKKQTTNKVWHSTLGIVSTILVLAWGSIHLLNQHQKAHPWVFILEPTSIYSDSKPQSLELGKIQAGVRVRLLKKEQDWLEIKTGTDTQGWVMGALCLVIREIE